MTVGQLLKSMDSAEIAGWIAFYNLESEQDSDMGTDRLEDKLKKAFGVINGSKGR